jgi:hypothetical protein
VKRGERDKTKHLQFIRMNKGVEPKEVKKVKKVKTGNTGNTFFHRR